MLYRDMLIDILSIINQNNCVLLMQYINTSNYIDKYKYYGFHNNTSATDIVSCFEHEFIVSLYKLKFVDLKVNLELFHKCLFENYARTCKTTNIKLVKILSTLIIENPFEADPCKYDFNDVSSYFYHGLYGHLRIIKYLINIGFKLNEFAHHGASQGGHLRMFKILDKKLNVHNIYSDCLYYAGIGAKYNIIDYYIKKVTSKDTCWANVFEGACYGNQSKLVSKIIKKDYIDYEDIYIHGFLWGCSNGKYDIVNTILCCCGQNLIDIFENTLNRGLSECCKYNQSKIFYLLIENGATTCNNCNKSIGNHFKK